MSSGFLAMGIAELFSEERGSMKAALRVVAILVFLALLVLTFIRPEFIM
ncbi:hypothetical protein [Candidatus Nanohalococcus occultus]|uniref:Uncharacterized protein n=1 Tax=Candidatus Nanohalococcus occultus TaxID=2978047 RepID=A0ABY8CI19_9ARCH|nr:hypothetical protein SVXNc_0014 [Candidatus Nanohaloarchaeota archaeon SVXNc]